MLHCCMSATMLGEIETEFQNSDLERSIYRHDGTCTNCNHVVAMEDLLPCHDGDGLKDYGCPHCFVPHLW